MVNRIITVFFVSLFFVPVKAMAINNVPKMTEADMRTLLARVIETRNNLRVSSQKKEGSNKKPLTEEEKLAKNIANFQHKVRGDRGAQAVDLASFREMATRIAETRTNLYTLFFSKYVNEKGTKFRFETPKKDLYTKYEGMYEAQGSMADFYNGMSCELSKTNDLINAVFPELSKCISAFSHDPKLVRFVAENVLPKWNEVRQEHQGTDDEIEFSTFLARLDKYDELLERSHKLLSTAIMMHAPQIRANPRYMSAVPAS